MTATIEPIDWPVLMKITAVSYTHLDVYKRQGLASIDESAITGESAPVIREAGGDKSSVTGGTKVLSDRIKVR